jgi:Mrp family chromosome partitioning ATPase
VQSVHRTLSLPQSSRPVLGADLNLSELVRRPTGLSENIADRGGDSAVAEPFSCPAGWPMYKHDGFRVIARKDGARVRLYSRPGNT